MKIVSSPVSKYLPPTGPKIGSPPAAALLYKIIHRSATTIDVQSSRTQGLVEFRLRSYRAVELSLRFFSQEMARQVFSLRRANISAGIPPDSREALFECTARIDACSFVQEAVHAAIQAAT